MVDYSSKRRQWETNLDGNSKSDNESDASNVGWGAFCNSCTMRGQWSASETLLHINAKEMLAAFLALPETGK